MKQLLNKYEFEIITRYDPTIPKSMQSNGTIFANASQKGVLIQAVFSGHTLVIWQNKTYRGVDAFPFRLKKLIKNNDPSVRVTKTGEYKIQAWKETTSGIEPTHVGFYGIAEEDITLDEETIQKKECLEKKLKNLLSKIC